MGSIDSEAKVDQEPTSEGSKRVKIVVVGDGAVGKTCLLISFATGEFPSEYIPTVFANYTTKKERNGQQVILSLWDTAGQEEFDRLRPLSYPGADVILLCYATISQKSFENVADKWAPEVKHFVPGIPLILVGTKTDLREQCHVDPNSGKFEPILREKGEVLAQQLKAAKFLEVSSKTRQGLDEVFNAAMDTVLAQYVTPTHKDNNLSGPNSERTQSGRKKRNCVIL